MPGRKTCREPNCGHEMPVAEQHCPHCGRPRRFPNVDLAESEPEQQALQRRYDKAVRDANKRGTAIVLQEFERFVTDLSRPVMVRSLSDVLNLSRSDDELVKTFAARGATSLGQGSHVLRGEKWKSIRIAAESALYGDENRKELHFAALSPDELGLSSYGECAITLCPELIAHRTTVFEENMLVFFARHGNTYFRTGQVPAGHLARWEARGRLAAVKHAADLQFDSTSAQFGSILLTSGSASADDKFVELHILGGMTVRTFAKVVLTRRVTGTSRTVLKALAADLKKWNVEWEDRSTTR